MSRKRAWYDMIMWVSLYLFWIMVFQKRAFAFSKTMTIEFCYLLFIAGNYYYNIRFIIPSFLYKRKYLSYSLLFVTGIIVAALLRVPLATYLSLHYFSPGKPVPGFYQLFLNSLLNISIWLICLLAVKLISDRIRFQNYVQDIEKEKIRNELDFLKAQFNPHFLFNSINSIYGNIDKGNSSARNMLLTFSEMLRYQLYECNTNSINIDREVDYIRNYVALQQTRKPDNLAIGLDIDENLKGFSIAPLLFIAFIENAFKYASHHEHEPNEVRISIYRQEDRLVFTTFNTKERLNGHKKDGHNGIGISNVKRRLELLYPQKHELVIHSDDSSYEAILKLVI